MFGYSSPTKYSGMIRATLILAVALTTARADTFFNLSSPCVVREGLCKIDVNNEDGNPMTNKSRTKTVDVDDLQQCADECEVQTTK